jgi:hypothetical protein
MGRGYLFLTTLFARVQLQGRRLPGGLSKRLRPQSGAIGIDAEDTPGEQCPRVAASAETKAFFTTAVGLIPAAPAWLRGPVRPRRVARRAAKCLSTSIFLMRPMAAPVLLLLSAEGRPVRFDREPEVRSRSRGRSPILRSDNIPSLCYAATAAALPRAPRPKV